MRKVFVAGGRGLVGRAVVNQLRREGYHVFAPSSAVLDLRDYPQVDNFIREFRPDAIVLAAARVGGIVANETWPVDFLMENLQIQTSVFRAAHANGVDRLLFMGSSCIYPKHAEQPMSPEALLSGPLEPTNRAYAVAKLAGVEACHAYWSQFDRNYFALLPSNVYGLGDNYREGESHVVPSMIRKFVAAKQSHAKQVCLLGGPDTQRELLHASDLAHAVSALLFRHVPAEDNLPINIPGREIYMWKLADTIADLVGFSGPIHFTGTHVGTPRKALTPSRELVELGWTPEVSLASGLAGCLEDYLNNDVRK